MTPEAPGFSCGVVGHKNEAHLRVGFLLIFRGLLQSQLVAGLEHLGCGHGLGPLGFDLLGREGFLAGGELVTPLGRDVVQEGRDLFILEMGVMVIWPCRPYSITCIRNSRPPLASRIPGTWPASGGNTPEIPVPVG